MKIIIRFKIYWLLAYVITTTNLSWAQIDTTITMGYCSSMTLPEALGDGFASGVGEKDLLWDVGQTLRVQFLDGSAFLQQKVMQYAPIWEQYANIKFDFVQNSPSDIKISFATRGKYYSIIGKAASRFAPNEPTMNLGFSESTSESQFRRLILHEFGHAIGLHHEHQHPENSIQWNKPVVYQWFLENLDWSREKVDLNLFQTRSKNTVHYCEYDPSSIMHYSVRQEHTLNNFSIESNSILSTEDKNFIQKLYPSNGIRENPICGAVEEYNLTTSVQGHGTIAVNQLGGNNTNCTTSCASIYERGAFVELTARPNQGYRFVRWSGTTCNNGTKIGCTVPMIRNQEVTAIFEKVTIANLSGEYRLRNVWRDKYLNQGYDYEGSPLYTSSFNEDWYSQIWEVKEGEEGTWRLKCKWRDWYLNIGATENGTAADVYPLQEDWSSQMWYLEDQGNNTFKIKNSWSGRYLNATSSETVDIYDARDWTSQLWVLEPVEDALVSDPIQLKEVAASAGVKFGFPLEMAITENPDIFKDQASVGTVLTYWKWDTHPQEGVYTWAEPDEAVAFGEANNMDLRGHPLVWGVDQVIPDWVLEKSPSEGEAIMLDHISNVVGRYKGRIKSWDVVNEAIDYHGNYRNSYWNKAMTAEYIIKAFQKAHEIDPAAELLYNDYGMEINRPKFDGIKNLLGWLQSENVGLTGLGWQLHVDVADVLSTNFPLAAYMEEISAMGLKNYITELDIRLPELDMRNPTDSLYQLKRQKQAYKKITEIFLNNSTRGDYFVVWGVSDRDTWWLRHDTTQLHYPLLYDANFNKKPAYWGVYEAFAEFDGTPNPPSTDLSGEYRLRNVWRDKYLNQGYDYEGSPLYTSSFNEDWYSQIWEIKKGADGTWRLKGKWKDWYLNIGATENGTAADVYPLQEDWSSQMWYLEDQGNNTFKIKNRWSGRYLNATSSETVDIYEARDWTSQLWVLESVKSNINLPTSNKLANANSNSKTVKTYDYLNTFKTEADQCLLLGQNIGWSLDEYKPLVQDLENNTGKKLGLIGGQLRYAPNEINTSALVQLYADQQNNGGLIELSMLPNNPWTGGSAWDLSHTDIWKLTTPGEDGYLAWRQQMDYFAGFLKELENAGVTVIWRPLMEMNGDWFWFGYQGRDNRQDYINLYRDMFDYFTNTWELNNLIWVYSASASYNGIPAVDHYYPGDDVVDVTGLDVYTNNLELPTTQYQRMVNLGKPFALTEFGPHHNDMNGSHDYHQYVNTIINDFPEAIYALAWHDWVDHDVAFISNQNYQQALSIPCVVERNETNLLTNTDIRFRANKMVPQQNRLEVFPNPATQSVMLNVPKEMSIENIQLIDARGKQITLEYSSAKASNVYQLNWEKIPTGLYFINLRTKQKSYSMKILIL